MKKNLFKRGMAGLLSLVMCLTALVGIGTTTAYAAGERAEVYLVSFPRSGDANIDYSGTWGHPNLQYMNGWHSGESKYTTIRAMYSYDGNICYCIEPGVQQDTGDTYTSKDETFWDNLPADINSTISPYDMKLFIGRIMQYGYTGPISTSWRSQNPADAATLAEAMATQVLIWETVVGERDEDFDYVSPGSYDAVKGVISTAHPLYDLFCDYYDSIEASVQRHSAIPSFMSKNPNRAQSVELEWDGSGYTATLTDHNQVLSDYSFSANEDGISFSVSGNQLIITATDAPSDSVRITANKVGSTRRGIITWTDGTFNQGSGKQDVITYAQSVSDPVQAFLNLKVSYGSAKIVKTSEDGKVDNLNFYDPDGNPVTMTFTYPTPTTIDVFYTNAEGSLVTPEKLSFGKGYSIVEVQAPYGYVLDETPVYFDVTEDNSTEESGVTVVKVDKPNMAQKGTITVEKTGEVFFGVSVIGGVDESGNELPTIYQPQYEKRGLPGAVYEIIAAEDIITQDGTVRNQKGEIVDTVTTDETGTAVSRELYLGKYEVREIVVPHGMVLNPEPHCVELVYAGQSVAVTETATSFENERQKVEISLVKSIEQNEHFGIGTNGEMKNISFGLFAAEEIVSASGTSIPADGLIEIISLNEDGTAKIKTDLPFGSYYVQELATDSHYMLSDTKYPVTFGYAGQDTAVVKIAANDGKAIENDLIYGSVSGKKVDENGSALGGALIGLFRTDDGEFTKENALLTATSAEDGSFSFENIPYGTWYVREIEQPAGFVLDDTIYPVTINADGQVVEIEIVNKYVRGNIHLTKVDSEYPDNKLTGATFEVYKDSNANGKLDDSDELLGTLTEKEKGEYSMNDLFYGRYFVKETKAPEGFVLDTGVYEVMIDTNGKTYEVENKAGVGFVNDAMRGNLKIVKTSSDGKVKGFTFRITGANGYDIILETNDKGEIFIDELRIGDYTISEVSNSASSMYVLPADKKATVKLGSTTIVEMHNVLRDTPKTGDTTNLPLLYALAGLSAVGIAVCGVIGFKKKEDRN